ncbi:MAG: hypothetical protein K0R29_1596 [Pseudobdellovibrio sp.]|jgi:hypothetical protein|nr:hypothetical protein [Pseudobdellovibrio sp.]
MADPALKQQSKVNDIDASDLGRPDTLRYNILTLVINEEYDRAIKTLKEFLESDSEYPNFKLKVERYLLHSIDLIYAIRTKRNFPGISSLTRTKQQELKDKFKEHFKELRFMMKKIEDCMEELRLNDVRSTHIVIKAFWLSVVVVFVAGISFEVVNGMGHSFEIVLNDYVETAINFLFNKIF